MVAPNEMIKKRCKHELKLTNHEQESVRMNERSYLEEEYLTRTCDEKLASNNKYIELSDKSIELFNQLKEKVNLGILLEYEETLSNMQCIAIKVAYNIGKNQKKDSD